MKGLGKIITYCALAFVGFLIIKPILFDESQELTLMDRAIIAGDYLKYEVSDTGKFTYQYDPEEDEVASKYNILRHAGTIYAMLELYETTNSQELLAATERAITYMLEQIETENCPINPTNTACIVEKDYVKVGGNGLAIVALAEYQNATEDTQYLPTMQGLAEWITSTQTTEGEFTPHKIGYSTAEPDDFVSGYYPGEALLGLIRLYELDNNEKWLNAATKGATWLIAIRDGDKSTDQLDHDHWLLYALNEIYRASPDQAYIDHSFKIVDAILGMQRQESGDYPDEWIGSYYTPPRSTPTATRSEGLIAAYNLAHDFGYPEKAEEILKGIELGINFQIKTQITENIAKKLKNPLRPIGAFRESLDDYTIRIDYVQHNISAILGYLEILNQTENEPSAT